MEKDSQFTGLSLESLWITLGLSFLGIAWAIFYYAISTKWFCCCKESLMDKVTRCFKEQCNIEEEEDKSERLCSPPTVVNSFTVVDFLGKLVLVGVNISFVVDATKRFEIFPINLDILATNLTSVTNIGSDVAFTFTIFCFAYELVTVVIIPICNVLFWLCCCREQLTDYSTFFEHIRFGYLFLGLILAPFSNTDLFFRGGSSYVLIILKLIVYGVQFSAAVIAGIRCIGGICGCEVWNCGCDNANVEIKNYKHIFVDIGLKMIAISLKLSTCSSAMSTYLKIGIHATNDTFRIAYFSFTVIRGISAMFSLGMTALFLRWTVTTDEKKEDESFGSSLVQCLTKSEIHTHVTFAIDMITYGGLLVLNSIIVHNIRTSA